MGGRYRLVLDEGIEHEVLHRLEDAGHDVVHVDLVWELGKGSDDRSIANYSLDADRLVVTYDDDFVLELDEDEYRGVIFVADATMSAREVADILDGMAERYPQEQIRGIEMAGREWL